MVAAAVIRCRRCPTGTIPPLFPPPGKHFSVNFTFPCKIWGSPASNITTSLERSFQAFPETLKGYRKICEAMVLREQIWHLRTCKVFSSLTAGELVELERHRRSRKFLRGDMIHLPGHGREYVFFLSKGVVKLS